MSRQVWRPPPTPAPGRQGRTRQRLALVVVHGVCPPGRCRRPRLRRRWHGRGAGAGRVAGGASISSGTRVGPAPASTSPSAGAPEPVGGAACRRGEVNTAVNGSRRVSPPATSAANRFEARPHGPHWPNTPPQLSARPSRSGTGPAQGAAISHPLTSRRRPSRNSNGDSPRRLGRRRMTSAKQSRSRWRTTAHHPHASTRFPSRTHARTRAATRANRSQRHRHLVSDASTAAPPTTIAASTSQRPSATRPKHRPDRATTQPPGQRPSRTPRRPPPPAPQASPWPPRRPPSATAGVSTTNVIRARRAYERSTGVLNDRHGTTGAAQEPRSQPSELSPSISPRPSLCDVGNNTDRSTMQLI